MFPSADDDWAWIDYKESIDTLTLNGVTQGILISLLSGLIVSRSLVVTLMATFCISFIMFGVLSGIQDHGWEIGVTEQTMVFLMLAIILEYVMHVCYQYSQSLQNNRMERMDFVFRQIGSTILGCTLLSVLSCSFLIASQANFFYKFGTLMLSTVFRSSMVALLFLPALLYIMGPSRTEVINSVLSKRT